MKHTEDSSGPKNRKIIHQIVPLIVIGILIVTLYTVQTLLISTQKASMRETEKTARSLARYASGLIEDTPNIAWLLDYWENNSEQMSPVLDDRDELNRKKFEFINANPGIDPDCVTEDQLSSMDAETMKAYAEIAYMELTLDLDMLKDEFHPQYLYCFSLLDDGEGDLTRFFLLTAKAEGETRGDGDDDIYLLGRTSSLNIDTHPILYETYETGREIAENETTRGNSESMYRYHVYIPIVIEGKTRCIVSTTIDATNMYTAVISGLFKTLLGVFFISAVIIVTMILVIRKLLVKPILGIQRSVRDFGSSMDDEDLQFEMDRIHSDNEIGLLASDMAVLGHRLADNIEEVRNITTEHERIGTELLLATRIQAYSLPQNFDSLPSFWPVKLFASMTPAKEVAGDFYDFIVQDADHMALVIADVSGKGVPASLMMMTCKMLIEYSCSFTQNPSGLMEAINNKICEHNAVEMFVTVWIGILEISTGKITAVNAGHEYPIIKRKDGEYEVHKDTHMPPLGIMEGISYDKSYEITLNPGDELFLYTDGIPEATHEKELYGMERLLKALNSSHARTPKQVTESVSDDIKCFVKDAAQFDDITMMSLMYK